MARGKPLTGKASMVIDGKKITFLSIDANGECHYHVSKEQMEQISKRISSNLQAGVNSCKFDTL